MKTGNKISSGIASILVLFWSGVGLAASPPERLNFQGVLRDATGAPANGPFEMEYHFFGNGASACDCGEANGSAGCSDLTCEADVCGVDPSCCDTEWDSSCAFEAESFPSCQACMANEQVLVEFREGLRSVTVSDGLFSTAFGKGVLLDGAGPGTYGSVGEVFRDYDIVYVEVRVEGETLSPRIRVESSAYTQNALQLEGKRAAEFLDTSAAAQAKEGDLEVQGDVTVGGHLVYADGSVAKSARPDPPCFDTTSRFVDCANGTVTDTVTGLIWLKDASCSSLGAGPWLLANEAAVGLSHGTCGLTDNSSAGDWRLPTEDEWRAILFQANTNGCSAPVFPDVPGTGCCGTETCAFSGVQSVVYWSTSTFPGNPVLAWMADLETGDLVTGDKLILGFVWPVRGGQ